MPKPKTLTAAYSVKSQDLLKTLQGVFEEALLKSKDKSHREALNYWYREEKSLMLLEGGDLTPKHKCKQCHGRGKYLLATPKSNGKYGDEDFKPHACPCIVAQVDLPDGEELYKKLLKQQADAEAKLNAGAAPNSGLKIKQPGARAKKSGPKTEEETGDKTPTKRRAKKADLLIKEDIELREGETPDSGKAKKTKNKP